jgi:phthalate 4,5-dioxygenase
MLTAEQNEQLTRVGPGTTMGALFRRYWLPVLLAEELPGPDGPPARVKLLGERLLAFRDTQGRLGLIGEFCAHRGVSLWFGRNEESGIRCSYHGWKYDVTGQCVDVPSEPAENGYCSRIKLASYPLIERSGVLWAYLGPPELRPEEPGYDWTRVTPAQRYVSKRLQECNFLQAMEGALDSIHSGFLHRYSVGDDPLLKRDPESLAMLRGDPKPKFFPTVSPGGLYVSTRRDRPLLLADHAVADAHLQLFPPVRRQSPRRARVRPDRRRELLDLQHRLSPAAPAHRGRARGHACRQGHPRQADGGHFHARR